MARPKSNTAKVNAYRFKWVLKHHDHIRSIPTLAKAARKFVDDSSGRYGIECAIDESGIRRNLKDGRMNPKVLEVIARVLNVDVRLLSGGFENRYELLTDADDRRRWEELVLAPKNHPFIDRTRVDEIDYTQCLYDLLYMHGISSEEFNSLNFIEQDMVKDSLSKAVTNALRGTTENPGLFPKAVPNFVREEQWDKKAEGEMAEDDVLEQLAYFVEYGYDADLYG